MLDDGDGSTEGQPGAVDIPPPVLTVESERYVRKKHYPGGAENTFDKSTFNSDEDPYALVEAAKDKPAVDQGDGTFRREVTVQGRYVGHQSMMCGGAATQRYIVVQDRFGAVITMHPEGNG